MMSSIGSMEKAFTKTFHINTNIWAIATIMTAKKVPIFCIPCILSKSAKAVLNQKKKKQLKFGQKLPKSSPSAMSATCCKDARASCLLAHSCVFALVFV